MEISLPDVVQSILEGAHTPLENLNLTLKNKNKLINLVLSKKEQINEVILNQKSTKSQLPILKTIYKLIPPKRIIKTNFFDDLSTLFASLNSKNYKSIIRKFMYEYNRKGNNVIGLKIIEMYYNEDKHKFSEAYAFFGISEIALYFDSETIVIFYESVINILLNSNMVVICLKSGSKVNFSFCEGTKEIISAIEKRLRINNISIESNDVNSVYEPLNDIKISIDKDQLSNKKNNRGYNESKLNLGCGLNLNIQSKKGKICGTNNSNNNINNNCVENDIDNNIDSNINNNINNNIDNSSVDNIDNNINNSSVDNIENNIDNNSVDNKSTEFSLNNNSMYNNNISNNSIDLNLINNIDNTSYNNSSDNTNIDTGLNNSTINSIDNIVRNKKNLHDLNAKNTDIIPIKHVETEIKSNSSTLPVKINYIKLNANSKLSFKLKKSIIGLLRAKKQIYKEIISKYMMKEKLEIKSLLKAIGIIYD